MSTDATAHASIPALLRSVGLVDLAEQVGGLPHAPCGEVRYGCGIAEQLGEMVRELGCKRPLVVTDAGLAKAGHLEKVLSSLRAAGAQPAAYSEVLENPDTLVVAAVVAAAQAAEADCFIGLGGGSSMDAAKGANFILTNGGRIHDYKGHGLAKLPMLPFIAVPTTSGTGSECQSYALISDAETHVKMACGDPKAAARIAVLDPLLTLTQPPMVTRLTGIDALTHALESAVSRKAHPISQRYSQAAFALLSTHFQTVCHEPDNLTARAAMLAGAALAGVAIENSMLGAAHATANPLTAAYGIAHGAAVGVMMPAVLELNLQDEASLLHYQKLSPAAESLPKWFREQLAHAGLPTTLRQQGVQEAELAKLAEAATQQWTGTFNPVSLTAAGFHALYTRVW
jgi:alcohol dehydrogenase